MSDKIVMQSAAELFGTGLSDDSGMDTDEMVAAAKAPIAKSRLKKKSAGGDYPDADGDDDGDEHDPERKKRKMEAMAAKRKKKEEKEERRAEKKKRKAEKKKAKAAAAAAGQVGPPTDYESGDSYDSGGEVARTADDDDFLDLDDDDAELLKEYGDEQNFDDERGEDEEGGRPKNKKKRARDGEGRSSSSKVMSEADKNNPIMQAMNKMKVRKVTKMSLEVKDEMAAEFVAKMQEKFKEDEESGKEGKLGVSKLKFLPEAVKVMGDHDMTRALLDHQLLATVGQWISPLGNGKLGNVMIRVQLLDAVGKMNGDSGVTGEDLKRSGFGKMVMKLYQHKEETKDNKRKMKALIEQWSRPIYDKSRSYKDLASRDHKFREEGFVPKAMRTINDQRLTENLEREERKQSTKAAADGGASSTFTTGKRMGGADATLGASERVSIPYSKGFQFTVRPDNMVDAKTEKIMEAKKVKSGGVMEKLNKSMIEKSRPHVKNQRSENMSVEGRQVK